MPDTSASLLQQLREQPSGEAWQRFVDLYSPWLTDWLTRHGVQPHDANDLVQEVLLALVRELPRFQYDPQRGSFRGWLRKMLVNRFRNFQRSARYRPLATGDSRFLEQVLLQMEHDDSDLSLQWDREHDRLVATRLLEQVRGEFTDGTWQAFQRYVVEGLPAAAVAAELGITINTVFIAKSRVLRRLRREIAELME